MTELPDRSTGESASTANYLALEDGLESLPRPAVASNRERDEADVVVGALKKRPAKECEINGRKDAPAAKVTTGTTGHEESSCLHVQKPSQWPEGHWADRTRNSRDRL